MSIGSRIKERRIELGITQEELARQIGVTKGAIANYENGISNPKIELMYKLFVALDCDANYLHQDDMRMHYNDKSTPEEFENLIKKYRSLDIFGKKTIDIILEREMERIKIINQKDQKIELLQSSSPSARKNPPDKIIMRTYPYFSKIACAGTGFYFDDIPMVTIEAPEYKDADFVIGVNGDSMEPDFSDGDMVYVKRISELKIGETGIFTIGNECYIKELGKDGLISKNKSYDTIPGSEDVRLIGKVIGKIKKDRK